VASLNPYVLNVAGLTAHQRSLWRHNVSRLALLPSPFLAGRVRSLAVIAWRHRESI